MPRTQKLYDYQLMFTIIHHQIREINSLDSLTPHNILLSDSIHMIQLLFPPYLYKHKRYLIYCISVVLDQ